jgi:hypothetical protein
LLPRRNAPYNLGNDRPTGPHTTALTLSRYPTTWSIFSDAGPGELASSAGDWVSSVEVNGMTIPESRTSWWICMPTCRRPASGRGPPPRRNTTQPSDFWDPPVVARAVPDALGMVRREFDSNWIYQLMNRSCLHSYVQTILGNLLLLLRQGLSNFNHSLQYCQSVKFMKRTRS